MMHSPPFSWNWQRRNITLHTMSGKIFQWPLMPWRHESANSHIKNKSKANAKNNTSCSLQLITQDTDGRISNVQNQHERELQLNVIGSKLNDAHLFSPKCVFMLHYQFDGRTFQKCTMLGCDSWIVWNFELVSVMCKISNNTICNVSFHILHVVMYQ